MWQNKSLIGNNKRRRGGGGDISPRDSAKGVDPQHYYRKRSNNQTTCE